jgi:ribosomal protein L12E/L44/L45/RPP1/RPP2
MAKRKATTAPGERPEYTPTPREAAAVEKLCRQQADQAPRLKVSKSKEVLKIGPDHPHATAGNVLLMEALATTDPDFFNDFVTQLAQASGGEVNEQRLNFLLSVVKGIKPRDQIETMLAGQMAAVHTATMELARSLAEAKTLEHRDSAERTFNRLTRTFVTQMEALRRYRHGGEQTVTVQHVNVGEGGQAIVGNVTQGRRDVAPNGTAAASLALTHDPTPPMPILDRNDTAIPVPVPRNAKTT